MTTVIAWVSYDHRRLAAFYLASDSRITWGTQRHRWDAGRKLFACARSPDMFGYCGDVLFPALVLGQIADAVNAGLLFAEEDEPEARHAAVAAALRNSFGRRHDAPDRDFEILHAARRSTRATSAFLLWRTRYCARTREWSDDAVAVPAETRLVLALGSGAIAARSHQHIWRASALGGTSRAVYGAFCDALSAGADPLTGGSPQLAALYLIDGARTIGVVYEEKYYLHGLPLPEAINGATI